jgi:anti-sigma factor RsiW
LNPDVRTRGIASIFGSRRSGLLAAMLVAAALALGGCGAAGTGSLAPAVTADGVQRVEVAFAGGAVTGGLRRYAVPLGSTVELVVASDVADEVHVHGYDRLSYVTAGATTTVRFVADLPGVFDVELEQRGLPLTQLEIA